MVEITCTVYSVKLAQINVKRDFIKVLMRAQILDFQQVVIFATIFSFLSLNLLTLSTNFDHCFALFKHFILNHSHCFGCA